MFAPHCPTCGHRVLLGLRRLVVPPPTDRGPGPFLRCHCGTVLDALAEHPAPAVAPTIPTGAEPGGAPMGVAAG